MPPTPILSVFAVTAGSVIVSELFVSVLPAELTVPAVLTPAQALIPATAATLAEKPNVWAVEPFPSASVARLRNVATRSSDPLFTVVVRTGVHPPGALIVAVPLLTTTQARRKSPSWTVAGMVAEIDDAAALALLLVAVVR